MLKYFDTPVLEIFEKKAEKAGVRLFVKREDLNHPFVSGNKWWKLKFNLEKAMEWGYHTVLTFGGAFSNHIYSTAAATDELGLKGIGIIRGEEILPLNPTLAFAKAHGMKFDFISREAYKKKSEEYFIAGLREKFGDFYLIPEGGSNALAVAGCTEFARTKLSSIDFDYLCLPIGTGGTLAGIASGLDKTKNVIGFSVLKNGGFLNEEVKKLLQQDSGKEYCNWTIQTGYDFGGYAKQSPGLMRFVVDMNKRHNLPLDPIYNGKMVAGAFDLIEGKYFPRGSTVLLLHTGGLQQG